MLLIQIAQALLREKQCYTILLSNNYFIHLTLSLFEI